MSGWDDCTIGDQITLQRGVDITKASTIPGPVPVISSGGTSAYHNQAIADGPGVIIGRKGSLGTVHWSEGAYWPHDTTLWVKDFKGNNPRFVYYFLTTLDTKSLDVGSSNPTLNRNHVHPLPVMWPTLREQDEIASILGALDDKIELNRRMSATLEEMARSLYRSWFVDFDPVHAKMEGRQPAFMDEATAALFPDRFGEDGLPEGWKRQAIGAHFHALKGLSYKGDGLCTESEGLPLHNLNSVLEGGGYKYAGIKYYSGEFKERHIVRPGDLIVANTEQGFEHMLIGHSAIIPRNFGPMGLFSHHLFKVEPNSRSWLSREWLYLTLSVSPAGTVVRSFSNGTTVNMLPADALELPQIIVPTEALASRFDELITPWFERRDEAIVQTETLAALRDSLLPKLMSGELRVGEARELIEEVA